MTVQEAVLTDAVLAELIACSRDWEREGSCHGYRENTAEDIAGNRVFLARDDRGQLLGYLFGHRELAKQDSSILRRGQPCFEIEELYVRPAFRSQGVGGQLFRCAEETVQDEVDVLLLSTATKNFRAILHFYIDELGMEFWSARLFKKLR